MSWVDERMKMMEKERVSENHLADDLHGVVGACDTVARDRRVRIDLRVVSAL